MSDLRNITGNVSALNALLDSIKDALPAGPRKDWESDDCYEACGHIEDLFDGVLY